VTKAVHVDCDTVPVEIVVASALEGDTIAAPSPVTFSGQVKGSTVSAATVALNSGAPVPLSLSSGAFSVPLALVEGQNTIVFSATSRLGTATKTLHVTYQRLDLRLQVAITAPAEGATILGARGYTVRGTISGATARSVGVKVNGTDFPASLEGGGIGFSAPVLLADGDNTIKAVVTTDQGSSSATVHVRYPFLTLSTFQAADAAIGQASLTAAVALLGGSATSLRYPTGSGTLANGMLFLSDSIVRRVIAYEGIPTASGAPGRFGIGVQTLEEYPYTTPYSARVNTPRDVRVAGNKLLVSDGANNRVLVFDPIPTGFYPTASAAVGALNWTSVGAGACTASDVHDPHGMVVVGGRLFVADTLNHRILVWNTIPSSLGVAADYVLGQNDLTSCAGNRGLASPNLYSLDQPTDVATDGTRLFVVDKGNHRILVWNTVPTTSGGPASFALGSFGTGRDRLWGPYSIATNGNQLFVADGDNRRVLVWNSMPTSSSALPDVVLGQSDFEHSQANDDNQDGVIDASPSARTFRWPTGLVVTDGALVVTDTNNHRALVFRSH
jgi:hypothetical protein